MTPTFDKMKQDHLEDAVALSKSVGWPHRREDWEMLLAVSHGYVARSEEKIIGTALRCDSGPKLSSVCMIIVTKEQRGRGLGRLLMEHIMNTDPSHMHRLIATEAGLPLYRSLEFEEVSRIAQFQGKVAGDLTGGIARDVKLADFDAICDLESRSFGGNRRSLIEWLHNHAQLAVVEDQGKVCGFAALRKFGKGHVIGPLVAENPDHTRALLGHFTHHLLGEFLRLDIAESDAIERLLSQLGLSKVASAPVMQRGGSANFNGRVAICGQALG